VIARPSPGPKPSFKHVSTLLVAVALAVSMGGCKKKQKPFPPAPPLLSSTATTEGASLGPGDAGVIPVRVNAITPSSLPTVADTMSPADRAAFEETKGAVRELEAMAKAGSLINPDKPDDGDANMKCSSIEPAQARLEALPDPDAKQLVSDERRLCLLEIPIISADKTLKQVTISPSQASRQLMCKYAAKDIDKARKEKPSDRRVRDLEARFARSCR
jgi:hypothetical protein